MEALLEHAFARYFETSGLFGTPARCLAMVERLRAIGVDEVACPIDFGVDAATVLNHLRHLDVLRELANTPAVERDGSSIAAQLARHGVTHLQCTPSMARMLVAQEESRTALASLRTMLVGGEALLVPLARELRSLLRENLLNMYGPTETTIWSATHEVREVGDTVPIGRPIANTRLYILDRHRRPTPPGVAGELYIGGAGVARGYLHRPELTADAPQRPVRDVSVAAGAPPSVVERQMIVIWEKILGLSPIGLDDDFFGLGGHSLLAAGVFARMQKCSEERCR
jgi:acyl-CoA synthetase (AMP-forming)/AMP-acid ligase II